MGLDMYITKRKKDSRKVLDNLEKGFIENSREYDNDELINKFGSEKILDLILHKYLFAEGDFFPYISAEKKVCYWRKANAIHKWFVDNIQDGEDDCGYYEIDIDKLKDLLERCKEVEKSLENSPKKVSKNGDGFEEEVFVETEIAEKLLPTQSGFFFGDTLYGECYLDDLKTTIKYLEDILDKADEYIYIYHASW